MNKALTVNNFSGNLCVQCVQAKQEAINRWFAKYEPVYTPIYTSVDIRDAGFKIAVVDTNLFPAGFNNLCEHGLEDAVGLIRNAIRKRVPAAKKILIAAEEHTRNTWYLENLRILQEIVTKAGFECKTAMLNDINIGQEHFDLIIMNNDLSGGIPDALREVKVPIFPSMHAGWHARHKSEHFRWTNNLIKEFAAIVGIDPWQFLCLYELVEDVDVNKEEDQQRLYQSGVKLFADIAAKYKEHGLDDKPFIFIKSDSGTYGRGVTPIEDPQQILELNRKARNDLGRGKGGETVHRFLLQEGVPTIHRIEGSPCEVCIYQIDNNLIGGFYRYHTSKGSRENLNSPGGMEFQKMCPHLDKYGKDCGIAHNMNIFDIYRILARIAGIAAGMEIMDLEKKGV